MNSTSLHVLLYFACTSKQMRTCPQLRPVELPTDSKSGNKVEAIRTPGTKVSARTRKIYREASFLSSWMSRRMPCMNPARVSVLRRIKKILPGPVLSSLRYTDITRVFVASQLLVIIYCRRYYIMSAECV